MIGESTVPPGNACGTTGPNASVSRVCFRAILESSSTVLSVSSSFEFGVSSNGYYLTGIGTGAAASWDNPPAARAGRYGLAINITTTSQVVLQVGIFQT